MDLVFSGRQQSLLAAVTLAQRTGFPSRFPRLAGAALILRRHLWWLESSTKKACGRGNHAETSLHSVAAWDQQQPVAREEEDVWSAQQLETLAR